MTKAEWDVRLAVFLAEYPSKEWAKRLLIKLDDHERKIQALGKHVGALEKQLGMKRNAKTPR